MKEKKIGKKRNGKENKINFNNIHKLEMLNTTE